MKSMLKSIFAIQNLKLLTAFKNITKLTLGDSNSCASRIGHSHPVSARKKK